MTNKLISFSLLGLAGLFAASACNNDVDTSAWLPNYTASGYAGAGGKPSAGAGGKAAAADAGEGGEGGTAASAGEAGAP